MSSASKIFCGYRVLGYVSNHIPAVTTYHKKHRENYVITCVGRSFHTYNCSKLGIVAVSDPHPSDISCIAVDGHRTFTGCDSTVRVFRRNKQTVLTLTGHETEVHILLPFGDHLVSVDRSSLVKVWDITSQETEDHLYLDIPFDGKRFEVTCVVHPATYLNKIILGSRQGSLKLWNIKTNQLIFSFPGWNSAVVCIEQAPAVDVLAVGLGDGQIIIHNVKFDETVVKFKQEWGKVTSISFRSDGQAIMATGSELGHVALWDLEERRLKCHIRDAHFASVSGLKFLPSEPLLVTSSVDNSLKIWIFDMTDGGGRILKQRAGHSAPPARIRHYGHNGHNILSAGQDSTLQSFSTIHDSHNKSLGRASFHKSLSKRQGHKKDQHMMSPIVDFASESTRESDWDNIVAAHHNLPLATTWSFQRSTMGEHKFLHKRFTNDNQFGSAVATCVAITTCGNFTLIGYTSGHIDCYNLQSGLYRGSYGATKAHKNEVRCVLVDALNQKTISAGAGESSLSIWRFKAKDILCTVSLPSDVSLLILHRESAMLAAALDYFTPIVIDIDTHQIIRCFDGHTSKLTDMSFSPDSRWLITSSMDSSVRTWDLPTGRLIDCFLVATAVTSLSFSPIGDFLATTHVDNLGVYLWSNMTLYHFVSLQPIPSDFIPTVMEMPTSALDTDVNISSSFLEVEDTKERTEFKSAEQILSDLITLSTLPESRWRNLLELNIIKQRNKPKDPPKALKTAPFFLPTVPGLEFKFDISSETAKEEKMKDHVVSSSSDLGKKLLTAETHIQYIEVFSMLKKLGPSALDNEIRSLGPLGGGSVELMQKFIQCISHVLDTNKDFEISQAYLGLFLKTYGDLILDERILNDELRTLLTKTNSSWLRLQNLFDNSLCLTTYIRSATL